MPEIRFQRLWKIYWRRSAPRTSLFIGLFRRSNLSSRGYNFWVSWAITSLGCWGKTHSDIVVILLFVGTFGVDLKSNDVSIKKDWKDKGYDPQHKSEPTLVSGIPRNTPFCCVCLVCLFVCLFVCCCSNIPFLLTTFILDDDCKFSNKIVKTRFMCI